MLLAPPRAAADQLLELRVAEDVAEPQRVALDPAPPPAPRPAPCACAARRRRARRRAPGGRARASGRRAPSGVYAYPFAWWTRGAVSRSSQRMSSAATKCQVGRITCVRRISPSANARSTSASGGEPADSLGQRPLDLGELLSLDGARPAHRLGHRAQRLAREPLARVAAAGSSPADPSRSGAGPLPDQLGVDAPRCCGRRRPSRSAARVRSPPRPGGRAARRR